MLQRLGDEDCTGSGAEAGGIATRAGPDRRDVWVAVEEEITS